MISFSGLNQLVFGFLFMISVCTSIFSLVLGALTCRVTCCRTIRIEDGEEYLPLARLRDMAAGDKPGVYYLVRKEHVDNGELKSNTALAENLIYGAP